MPQFERGDVRAGKDTGIRNLPHHAFEHNQTWLELSLIAQDLLVWMKLICLDGSRYSYPSAATDAIRPPAGTSPTTPSRATASPSLKRL